MKIVQAGKLVFWWLIAFLALKCRSQMCGPNKQTRQDIPVKHSKPVNIKKCTLKKQPAPSQSDGCQRKCLTLKEKVEVEKYSEINGLLWEWYTRRRASNIPVDGPMLVEEAQIIAERIGDDTFKETSGWLEKWKKRHNIGQMNIAGEEGDVNPETIDSWNERVKELTKGCSPRDVWNEDETGCLWKVMPEKLLSQKGKRFRGVIGSSRLPLCFACLPNPSYPCGAQYFSNEKVRN